MIFWKKSTGLSGSPHFMLLDREGRFIAYSFVRPSEPECVELLEKHLN